MTVTSAPPATIAIKEAITAVVDGQALTHQQAAEIMDVIMTGGASGAQIAAIVTALRVRGETVDEIAGFASAMRSHALHVPVDQSIEPLVDTCGTGGDASGSFNISTTAAFVIAGAGVRVAKHGNRAMTSRCGSADLLEGLGVMVELDPSQVATCIEQIGIGFMYAPAFHPAMRFVGPTRREIGIRTVFNMLGPLTNPAGALHQLIGVGHPGIAGKLAEALARLGSQRAVLVHAEEGLDELGLSGPSHVTQYDASDGEVRNYRICPEDFGLSRATRADITGGDVRDNIRITQQVLSGERGPQRDIVLLNAGAGIFAATAAASIDEGIAMARTALNSGAALAKATGLAELTQQLAANAAEEQS